MSGSGTSPRTGVLTAIYKRHDNSRSGPRRPVRPRVASSRPSRSLQFLGASHSVTDMDKSLLSRRRTNVIAVAAVAAVLAVGGLSACGSSSSDESPDTTIGVKNGVLRTTTTKVPSTIQMPHGGSGGKPSRP